jgi:hypothetical protein
LSKHRFAAKCDTNQAEIVKALRSIPGVTVATGHDDLLLGFKGRTFWLEVKATSAVSKRTGRVLESAKKQSQKKLETTWTGHYQIVSSFDEILQAIGIIQPSAKDDPAAK